MPDQHQIPRKHLPTQSGYAAIPLKTISHSAPPSHSEPPSPLHEDGDASYSRPLSWTHGPEHTGFAGNSPSHRHSAPKHYTRTGTYEALETNDPPYNKKRTGWQLSSKSLWLSEVVLCLFGVLMIAMIASLILLYHFSNSENGFSVGTTSNPFAWRYGPVALITVVAALWHQVDYQSKIAAPWLHMQTSVSTASRSMLLDYVSPWLPVAVAQAITDRDWHVAACGSAYALLKIVILLSTGLLAVQEASSVKKDEPISLVWNPHEVPFNGTYDPGPVDVYWGILAANLEYPRGTNAFAAFQTFSGDIKWPPNATASADVEGFFATLECEVATSKPVAPGIFQSFTNQCSTGNWTMSLCQAGYSDCSVQQRSTTTEPAITYSAIMQPFYCGEAPGNVSEPGPLPKYLLAIVEGVTTLVKASNGTSSPMQTASASAAMFCIPGYSIETAKLSLDTSDLASGRGTTLTGPLSHTGKVIDGYSPADFADDLATLLDSAGSMIPDPSTGLNQKADYFFSLILAATNQTDLKSLTNTDDLAKSAETVFQGLGAQIANQWLVPKLNTSTVGTVNYTEQRLFVQLSSLWAMCVGLALITICISVVAFFGWHKHPPKAAGSISWNLFVLRMNVGLRKYLGRYAHFSNAYLHDKLSGRHFSARQNTGTEAPKIEILDRSQGLARPETLPCPDTVTTWWRPFALRRMFILCTVLLLIALIVILEVIQRKSGNDGFAGGAVSATLGHALSTYLPAAILLSTATILNMTDFAAKVFAPYQCKHLTGKPASASIMYSAFNLPPLVLLQSLLRGQYGVALATICTLLGGVLTIISAGLYSISSITSPYSTTFPTIGSLNLSYSSQDMALRDNLVVSLLEYYNATYPNGTYDEIIYPLISFDSTDPEVQSLLRQNQSYLEVTSNVLRPSLNCSEIPTSEIVVVSIEYEGSLNVTAIGSYPEECQKSGTFNGYSQFRLGTGSALGGFQTITQRPSSGGSLVGIDPYPFNGGEWGMNISSYGDGCPSLGFLWGTYSNVTLQASNFAAYTCSQYVEAIPATLTFLTPNLVLDQTRPPVLDESNSKVVSLHQLPTDYLAQYGLGSPNECDSGNVDPLFTAAICGSQANITQNDLGNPDRREAVLEAAHHVYRLLTVQTMNSLMRTNSTSDPAIFPQVSAKIMNANRLRIKQNNTSKIILQSLLAGMLVCFLGSYSLMSMRSTLPHNAMTLAGSMSLLAGGKLCNEDHDPTETFEDFEARLQHHRFRLGWWPASANSRGEKGEGWFGIDVVPTQGEG